MSKTTVLVGRRVSGGVVHKVPDDLSKVLISSPSVLTVWNNLTPLARNEWICWTTFVKKPETRRNHVQRVRKELLEGKRRPCCWIGCIHRTDKQSLSLRNKPISSSVQGVLRKKI